VRWLITVWLLARIARADPIEDREREAERLEKSDELASLRRASELRAALGQRAPWIADTQRAVRLHATTHPAEVAAMMFDLAAAFEGDARAAHLRAYLRRFGEIGGSERSILAHANLGEQAWRAACPIATIDGLCARRQRAHATSCDPTRERWVAVTREPRLVRRAVSDLEQAIRHFDAQPSTSREVRAVYSRAKLVLADHELEQLLGRSFPKLSFTTTGATKRSAERFNHWLRAQTSDGAKVVRRCEAIAELREPGSMLASTARIGQSHRILASQFLSSPAPHDMGRGPFGKEKLGAYCEAMRSVAEPLDVRATNAFVACATWASSVGVHDAWSEGCFRELATLDPEDFPPLRELVAKPGPLPP